MKKFTELLLLLVVFLALPSCSDDDEPNHIDPQSISGTWYVTNVRGWEYDDDAQNGKSEFNETFNFNGQGLPVGNNKEDAQKITISYTGKNSDNGNFYRYYIDVTNYYWGFNENIRDWEWKSDETETITLQDNKLIDGTMEATITSLTDKTMTTYQKDADGEETYITYTRL